MSHDAAPENHICEYEGCEVQSVCGFNGRYWCQEHLREGLKESVMPPAKIKELLQ